VSFQLWDEMEMEVLMMVVIELVVLVYGIFYMPSTTETNIFTPVSRDLNHNLGALKWRAKMV